MIEWVRWFVLEKEEIVIVLREVCYYKFGIGFIFFLIIFWWNYFRVKVIFVVFGEKFMYILFFVNLWMFNKFIILGLLLVLYIGVMIFVFVCFFDNSIMLKMMDNWRNMVKWMVVFINVYIGDRYVFW